MFKLTIFLLFWNQMLFCSVPTKLVTGQKISTKSPPDKSLPDKSHPDKRIPKINPPGLLKRLLRNMPFTLTYSD